VDVWSGGLLMGGGGLGRLNPTYDGVNRGMGRISPIPENVSLLREAFKDIMVNHPYFIQLKFIKSSCLLNLTIDKIQRKCLNRLLFNHRQIHAAFTQSGDKP
jgi:hypothetical protein